MHYCALSASRIFRSGATIWTHSLLSLVNDRAVTIADELGIEHLDLMSVLTPSLENYYDFTHFTPAGARVVAGGLHPVFSPPPGGSASPHDPQSDRRDGGAYSS